MNFDHRVLVYGGRTYKEWLKVYSALDHLHSVLGDFVLINGGAQGADTMSHDWGLSRGQCVVTIDAAWDFYKNAAGPIRNRWMNKLMNPTFGVEFEGGKGTKDMRDILLKANIFPWCPDHETLPQLDEKGRCIWPHLRNPASAVQPDSGAGSQTA